jgi:hypothetical protein
MLQKEPVICCGDDGLPRIITANIKSLEHSPSRNVACSY